MCITKLTQWLARSKFSCYSPYSSPVRFNCIETVEYHQLSLPSLSNLHPVELPALNPKLQQDQIFFEDFQIYCMLCFLSLMLISFSIFFNTHNQNILQYSVPQSAISPPYPCRFYFLLYANSDSCSFLYQWTYNIAFNWLVNSFNYHLFISLSSRILFSL